MQKPVEDAAQSPYGLRTQRRIQFDDKNLSMGTFDRENTDKVSSSLNNLFSISRSRLLTMTI